MASGNLWPLFYAQREEFYKLHEGEVLRDSSGLSSPSPERAQDFAEALILCPTMESIQARMRQDLEGARSFLIVADQIQSVDAIGSKNVELSEQRLKKHTPFYLLACAALDALEIDKQKRSGSQG